MEHFSTLAVQNCLERLHRGEADARDALIRCAAGRLQKIASKMLKNYARVQRWEDTNDVFQNAMIRLCRALESVVPNTPREFYALANVQIRRELIDLARHYYGPQGMGAHHQSDVKTPSAEESTPRSPLHDPGDLSNEGSRLALWTEFHRLVEQLPQKEKEIFDLLWYQGLTQLEAAEILGVTDRTVKNRWREARLKLYEALGGQMPGQ